MYDWLNQLQDVYDCEYLCILCMFKDGNLN